MGKFGKYVSTGLLGGGLLLGGLGLMPGNATIGTVLAGPKEKEKEKERHPKIHRAIHELEEARKDLKEADHDFKGHRDEAIEAIDVAIKQLRICLEVDKH